MTLPTTPHKPNKRNDLRRLDPLLKRKTPYEMALSSLEKYKTDEGKYRIREAYEEGMDRGLLSLVFGEEQVKGIEDHINLEKTFEPYKSVEGEYNLTRYNDLTKAGITDEQISRFFGEEALKRLKNPEPTTPPEETPAETSDDTGYLPPDEDYISKIPVPPPPTMIEIQPVENPAKATANPENLSPGEYYISQVPVPLPPEKLKSTFFSPYGQNVEHKEEEGERDNDKDSDLEELEIRVKQALWEQTVLPSLPDEIKRQYEIKKRAEYIQSQFDAGNFDAELVNEWNSLPQSLSDEEINDLITNWQEEKQAELTGLFETVMPGFFESLDDEQKKGISRNLIEKIYTEESMQKYFLDIVKYQGRNENTVKLLQTLMPDITERDIRICFGENVIPLNQLPLAAYRISQQPLQDVYDFAAKDPEGLRLAMRYEGRTPETEAMLKNIYGKEAMTEQYLKNYFEEGLADKFLKGEWIPDCLEDYWDMGMQGVGDILSMAGGIADKFGADSLADHLKLAGAYGQVFSKDVTPADPYSPRWFAQNLARMAPLTLGLIGVSVISGGTASGIVAWAGGRVSSQLIASRLASTVISSLGEGMMEAGDAYNEAKRRGFTDAEADQVFTKVFFTNLGGLSISNGAQYALTFFTPGGKTASVLTIAYKFGTDTALEGIEEGGQLGINRWALGDAQKFDDEMFQNLALGAASGFTFASLGEVKDRILSKISETMAPSDYDQFRREIYKLMGQGSTRKEAEAKAWENYFGEPENSQVIDEAFQGFLAEEKLELQKLQPEVNEAVKKIMNITGGTDPKVDELVNELQGVKEEELNHENNEEIPLE
jgi:hypothetical protein